MAWTDGQWAMFVSLVKRGFAGREAFTTADEDAYRVLLDDVDPLLALRALRELVAEGKVHRPRPGEIASRCRRDVTLPTFDEALTLLYRRRGVLDVRVRGTTDSNPRWREMYVEAVNERLQEVHPAIGGFVKRAGLERLRTIDPFDPDVGHWRRDELRTTWEEFVDSSDAREVVALAAGTGRQGLRTLDPLAALQAPPQRALREAS